MNKKTENLANVGVNIEIPSTVFVGLALAIFIPLLMHTIITFSIKKL